MFKYLHNSCFFLFLLAISSIQAQNTGNEAILDERRFVQEVKQIDEFLERFNADPNTLILEFINEQNAEEIIYKRADLVRYLFDPYDHQWDPILIKSFIDFVANDKMPRFISYVDPNWYAEVWLEYEGKQDPDTAMMVMEVNKHPEGGFHWVFSGIDPSYHYLQDSLNTVSLPPVAHGLNFKGLHEALNLTHEKHQLSLRRIAAIKYHFFQIPGWKFTVEYFSRQTAPSGWLISELLPMSKEDKNHFKKDYLHLK